MIINETKITRILNPTSIDLGDYVINPYKGCSYGCLYCYVRFNKVTLKDPRNWGEYVDVRVNAPELLEKEIAKQKPKRVLLGSTTECFQPIEKEYGLTRKILQILNEKGVYFSILTRSPLITEYIDLLKGGFCESVYFTVNSYVRELKDIFEPKSPSFESRVEAVKLLLEAKLPVIPYFSPILPLVSDYTAAFEKFPGAKRIDFEGLNFNLGNINKIIDLILQFDPKLGRIYKRLCAENDFYDTYWGNVKKDIGKEAVKFKKDHNVYIHSLSGYFENSYGRDTLDNI